MTDTAKIGGLLYDDNNVNGQFDSADNVVTKRVPVQLLDPSGNVIRTTETDSNGRYQFDNVAAGNYRVRFLSGPGVKYSPRDVGNDETDSDVDQSGTTPVFSIGDGQNFDDISAGCFKAALIGDRVFDDSNGNGIQDDGEVGISNAVVRLLDVNGTVVKTTATNNNGEYLFTDLLPGKYRVSFITPNGFDRASPKDQGGNNNLDSDVDPNTGETDVINLGVGAENRTVDAGFIKVDPPQKATLGDKVFEDLDQDGIQDDNESGVSNVVVRLLSSDGSIIRVTATDDNGNYLFTDLDAGDYQVKFVQPGRFDGFSPQDQGGNDATDSDADPNTGLTDTVTLAPGENNRTIDAGLIKDAPPQNSAIEGEVFDDTNKDGIQDPGEPGVPNVIVRLQNPEGQTVRTAVTDDNGDYSFTNVTPGDYKVTFVRPGSFDGFSPQDQGSDDTVDSDPAANGMTDFFSVAPGETKKDVDAGLVKDDPAPKATLGDKVFEDLDGDGIQDGNEPGVSDVVVRLINSDGNVIRTTATDDSGEYLFTNLDAGDYQVRFSQPGRFDGFTVKDAGDDTQDSDADPNTGLTDTVTLAPGDDNRTVDAGLVKDAPPQNATIGDKVFDDTNKDGIQDSGEPGVPNVIVRLQNPEGQTVSTAVTDDNGEYSFTNVTPGSYKVTFVRPGNFDGFSPQDQGGNDATDSDPASNGMTEFFSVTPGENKDDVDAGLVKDDPVLLASLGDKVFEDLDGDGIQDGNEPGVSDVVVRLINSDGNVIRTTATDDSGEYLFTNLDAGDYQVRFSQPGRFDGFTVKDAGDDTQDSDADPNTGLTDTVTLAPGDDNRTVDAGLVKDAPPQAATIGDKVFEDLDEDGIQDPGEPGVPGVTVRLEDPNGNVVDTTTTDGTGEYTFDDVDPGQYKVTFVEPNSGFDGFSPKDQGGNDAVDSDPAPDGMTDFFTVAPGENKDDVDAGLKPEPQPPQTATLGDRVFEDTDRDGIQDAGEPGVPNAVVRLENDQGNTVATDTTDSSGNYLFENLTPDDYRIIVERPGNFDGFSPQDQGTNNAVDSDVNNSGTSDFVTLQAGDDNRTVDAGLVKDVPPQTATLGDRVFEDTDRDGIQDAGEPGVPNAVVRLENDQGNTVATDTTDSSGNYLFENLTPDDYRIIVERPGNFDGFSPQDQGTNNAVDSDVNNSGVSDFVTLQAGDDNRTIDAGLVKDAPPELASVGDKVFEDLDRDGIQDSNEPGVPNVSVRLETPDGQTVDTTTTDGDGEYTFDNVDPGTYKVTFVQPGNFDGFSPQNQGSNDAVDSDPAPDGMTEFFTVTPGENKDDVDAGLVKDAPPELATLGDKVFDDQDGDGIQDPGEPGVAGVTVRLQDPNGNDLQTDTTDSNGNYLFDDLTPGQYKISVDQPGNFDGFSPQDQGGDDAEDSDIDPNNGMSDVVTLAPGEDNRTLDAGLVKDVPPELASLGDLVFDDQDGDGIQDPEESGVANVVVRLEDPNGNVLDTDVTDSNGNYLFDDLTPGQYKITVLTPNGFDGFSPQDQGGDDATDSDIDPNNGMSDFVTLAAGEDNRNLDAGLVKDTPPELARLGDTIFDDQNRDGIQDPNEPGVPDTVIRLLDADGNTVDTEVTDANGNYSFEVPAGQYRIRVQTPNGFTGFSPQNQGGDDTLDSDINPTNGESGLVTLSPGEVNNSVDGGVVKPLQGGSVGDFVFNDLDGDGIQDDNEPGIPGARVLLQDPNANTLEETTTDANGNYLFDDLAPGQYKVTFEQPDGFNSVSPFLAGGDRANDSDANPNNGLMSQVFTLGEGEVNNTIDAGFFGQAPDVNPDVDIEKLVRVEAEGTDPGIDLCNEFGDPVGLIFEYVGGAAVNQTAQGSATVTGPTLNDTTVEVLSTIPGDPVVIIPGGGKGKGKGKGKAGKAGKVGKGGKGKGGIVNPPNPNPTPDPLPDGTPISLGQTFIVRPGADDVDLQVEGAAGTQLISYGADCVEPIQLGDVIGGLRLVGFEGTSGSTRLAGNSSGDLDADDAPGPDAVVGDNIVFTYVVRNTGDTPIGNVQVSDNVVNPTFVGGDTNNNDLLDIGEEWNYTASETASAGLRTNIGTIDGIAVDVDGTPILVDDGSGGGAQQIAVSANDPANYTGADSLNPIEIPNTEITPPTPPIQGDLCDTLGKPTSLTFLYRPSNAVNTVQEKFEIDGSADDDNIAFIVGGGKGKGGKGKGGVTTGTGQQVSTGETFTVGVDGSNTNITILDDAGGPTLQAIEIHTSCSDVLQLGDQIGSITIVGYTGEDGSTQLTQEQIDDLFG